MNDQPEPKNPELPNPYRLKAEWQAYRRKIVPKDASPLQIKETEWAFYAGATCLLSILLNSLAAPGEPTETDKAIRHISEELVEFVRNDVEKIT